MVGSTRVFQAIRLHRSRDLLLALRATFVVVAVLPLGVPVLESYAGSASLGRALRALYGLQCHQRLERSWAVAGIALPVCARCLGIYLGIGLAGLVCRPRLRRESLLAWIVIGSLLLLLDVLTVRVHLRAGCSVVRAATGAFVAYGVALAMLGAVRPRRR